jgi:hypothetical protein
MELQLDAEITVFIDLQDQLYKYMILRILVAARSTVCFCGRSLSGIADSNNGIDVSPFFECCVLSDRCLCSGPITCPEVSYWVVTEFDWGTSQSPLGLSSHETGKICNFTIKNFSHRNNKERSKEEFGSHNSKASNLFATKNNCTRSIAHDIDSTAFGNLNFGRVGITFGSRREVPGR